MPTLTEKIDSRKWTAGDRPAVTLHHLLAGRLDAASDSPASKT